MRVVVAMSGGVDSSVVAGLLVREGHEVIGVHMRLHDESATAVRGSSRTCCGFDDALDARRVADELGIPFYVSNLRSAFDKAVMTNLADTYLAGHTPNPCIRCNGVLKFRVLLSRALALGATHLATGHYARISDGSLREAADSDKDQSYFLFQMTTDALERTLFPLGLLSKPEVRTLAAELRLPVADKPESQEVCFLPDGDHARFVRERHPSAPAAGPITLEDGTVVGRHDAYYQFTVGQRRGLRVALGQPAYVLQVIPEEQRVVVTTDPDRLGSSGMFASGALWHRVPDPMEPVEVRIRHRGQKHPATVVADGPTFQVTFADPVRAVAPGQAAVVYQGDRVLGGGWIGRALSAAEVR